MKIKIKNLICSSVTQAFVALSLLVFVSSCTNNGITVSTSRGIAGSPAATSTPTNQKLNILSTLVTWPSTSASPSSTAGTFAAYFSSASGSVSLTRFCATPTSPSGQPCGCEFTWQDENGNAILPILRKLTQPLTVTQPYVAQCALPAVFQTEISATTPVSVRIISSNDRGAYFSTDSKVIYKSDTTIQADFRTSDGQALANIHRYTCIESLSLPYNQIYNGVLGDNAITPSEAIPFPQTWQDASINSAVFRPMFVPLANKFQLGGPILKYGGGTSSVSGTSRNVQSHYYNLYVQSYNKGSILSGNSNYECPRVYESLAGRSTVGQQGSFFPLDSQFALGQVKSTLFSIPVEGQSILSSAAVPNSGNNTCSGASTPPNNGSISSKCLGFAMKTNTDGGCPVIRDSNNLARQTFRLRRFVAVYPPEYETTGNPIANSSVGIDTIYVLDRRVESGDPLKPYSMLGPKPCPYAWFDKQGVVTKTAASTTSLYDETTLAGGMYFESYEASSALNDVNTGLARNAGTYGTSGGSSFSYFDVPRVAAGYTNGGNTPHFRAIARGGIPQYVGTNHPGWIGKNPNGTSFPFVDDPETNSCAAIFPILKYNANSELQSIFLSTSHYRNPASITLGTGKTIKMNRVWVRPLEDSFKPNYMEDTTFQACAPESSPIQDPPLHFVNDSKGEVAWCAAVYPSQNETMEEIDQRVDPLLQERNTLGRMGWVRPFTSSAVKNAPLSGACTATVTQKMTDYATNRIQKGVAPPAGVAGLKYPVLENRLTDWALHGTADLCSGDDLRYFGSVDVTGSYTHYAMPCTKTCDRTIVITDNTQFKSPPLLAPPAQIEDHLRDNSSYRCTLTSGPSANLKTPAQGCCNTAAVTLPRKTVAGNKFTDAAHFEPNPNVSFGGGTLLNCGAPTEN